MVKLILPFCLLFSTALSGQFRVEVLKDINPATSSVSSPDVFLYTFPDGPFADRLWISADDGVNGREFWQSDGTEAGTVLQIELSPGAASSELEDVLASDNFLFFSTQRTGEDRFYWQSDGTQAGTLPLGSSTNFSGHGTLAVLHDTLYRFGPFDSFRSDGQGGWDVFTDVEALGRPFLFRDQLYFMGKLGAGPVSLWKSDGTSGGTTVVRTFPNAGIFALHDTQVVGDLLYLLLDDGVNGRELWRSDGTEAGTFLVRDIVSGPAGTFDNQSFGPRGLAPFRGELYFAVDDLAEGDLWKTDGTEAGTVPVADVYAGLDNARPRYFQTLNDQLYFLANSDAETANLWATTGDTSPGSTFLVADLPDDPAGDFGTSDLFAFDGLLFFRTSNDFWWSDGENAQVLDARTNPLDFTPFNGNLYFTARNSDFGKEIARVIIPLLIDVSVSDSICFGSSSGSITLELLNGTPPYRYAWNDASLSGPNPSDLPAGDYVCTITDADGDSLVTDPIRIAEYAELLVTAESSPASPGQANGTATLVVEGGQAPYTFIWATDPPQTENPATGLEAGTYTYEVEDDNGCRVEGTVAVDQNTALRDVAAPNELAVYPNPSPSGTFTWRGLPNAPGQGYQLELFGATGRKQFSALVSSQDPLVVDLSQLPPGPYFYRLVSDRQVYIGGPLLLGED